MQETECRAAFTALHFLLPFSLPFSTIPNTTYTRLFTRSSRLIYILRVGTLFARLHVSVAVTGIFVPSVWQYFIITIKEFKYIVYYDAVLLSTVLCSFRVPYARQTRYIRKTRETN